MKLPKISAQFWKVRATKKMEYSEPITTLHLVELETPICVPQSNLDKTGLTTSTANCQENVAEADKPADDCAATKHEK